MAAPTLTGGKNNNSGQNGEIRTFPEKLEIDLSELLLSNLNLANRQDGKPEWVVIDREGLMYDILDYIVTNYDKKKSTVQEWGS